MADGETNPFAEMQKTMEGFIEKMSDQIFRDYTITNNELTPTPIQVLCHKCNQDLLGGKGIVPIDFSTLNKTVVFHHC